MKEGGSPLIRGTVPRRAARYGLSDATKGGEVAQLELLAPARVSIGTLHADRGPVPVRQPDRGEITGSKGSIFYRAHSYHTKVPPEGIAQLIEHYTRPGATVLDLFCGSGMTGLACLLTGRRGILSDLSPAAVHIAGNYVAHVDPEEIARAGRDLLAHFADLEADLYGAACRSCGGPGRTEYVVWSDVYACSRCDADVTFWHGGLDDDRSKVQDRVTCAACGHRARKRDMRWLRVVPMRASTKCPSCRRAEGPVTGEERTEILRLDRGAIPYWFPTTRFESWREMWRGQHRDQGIVTAADFFTTRNLWALAAVWDYVQGQPDSVRDPLSFVFTAVVHRASRRYQWNPKRPTNVLTSTMYLASLSYEFNVFSLLRRKLSAAVDLYRRTAALPGAAEVHCTPAQRLAHVPDGSIDYVFTDPPFGSNIFYSDSSFLWEAWLREETDMTAEAVVNKSVAADHGGKDVAQYEKLMTEAFEEVARVLRPNAWASVLFHNSDDEVWSALQRSVEAAGFEVGAAVAFDKTQPSFKAIKGRLAGERVPAFDVVLHLRRRPDNGEPSRPALDGDRLTTHIRGRLNEHLATAVPSRRTTPYLHSLVMRLLLEDGLALTGWTYRTVEDLCAASFECDGAGWRLRVESDGG